MNYELPAGQYADMLSEPGLDKIREIPTAVIPLLAASIYATQHCLPPTESCESCKNPGSDEYEGFRRICNSQSNRKILFEGYVFRHDRHVEGIYSRFYNRQCLNVFRFVISVVSLQYIASSHVVALASR